MRQLYCEKCGDVHDGSYGSGRFCCSECAHSRICSEETKSKIAESLRLSHSTGRIKVELTKWREAGAKHSELRRQQAPQKRLERVFDDLCWGSKRMRVIQEQNGTCSKCGLTEWLGQKIPLEIDHVDGDHNNDSRENLRALCPNCHALTPTWRGRNNKQVK